VSQLESMLSPGKLPPSRHRRSWAKWIAGLVTVALAVAMIGYSVTLLRGSPASEEEFSGSGVGEVVVIIERGDTLTRIARKLEDAGVISSADTFINVATVDERSATIGPGKYTLRGQMGAIEALDLLLDPVARKDSRLVLPEGLRMNQTVEASVAATDIPRADFEEALAEPGDLGLPAWARNRPEGFLFPATYDIAGDESAVALLKSFVSRFNQASAEVGLEERAPDVGLKPYKVLTVASIVQAEVSPADFAKAARVVYNRLDQGMPLQMDSTVAYALGINDIRLNEEQLATSSPYNTYENKGLPPGPINSPGEAAMEAALDPAEGDWLYFVTVNPATGETKFTADYQEFLEFKREFQSTLAELEE